MTCTQASHKPIPACNSLNLPSSFAAAMIGDAMFSCPALKDAILQRDAGTKIDLLRSAVVDPVMQSARLLTPHIWEVEGVWGPSQATQYVALPGADSYHEGGENHELVRLFRLL